MAYDAPSNTRCELVAEKTKLPSEFFSRRNRCSGPVRKSNSNRASEASIARISGSSQAAPPSYFKVGRAESNTICFGPARVLLNTVLNAECRLTVESIAFAKALMSNPAEIPPAMRRVQYAVQPNPPKKSPKTSKTFDPPQIVPPPQRERLFLPHPRT